VPVAATRLADVSTRNPHPLVLGGSRQHLLQQVAIASLELILLPQGVAGLPDPIRKRVANPLELLEPGNARLGKARRDLCLQRKARKGLGAKKGQLVLEPTDLTAQLSAREALIASHSKRRKRVSIEQIRHKPEIECRSRCCG
jgi:hypothetical protein